MDINKIEDSLRFNIALFIADFKKKGYDMEELNKISNECYDFICERIKSVNPNSPIDSLNIKNLIVMWLFHGSITERITITSKLAEKKGVSVEAVEAELLAETMSILKQFEKN